MTKLDLSEPIKPRSIVRFSSCFKVAVPSPKVRLRFKTKLVSASVVSKVVPSLKVKVAANAPRLVLSLILSVPSSTIIPPSNAVLLAVRVNILSWLPFCVNVPLPVKAVSIATSKPAISSVPPPLPIDNIRASASSIS